MLPPSLAEHDQLNVPDVATFVAPLEGDGEEGDVGAAADIVKMDNRYNNNVDSVIFLFIICKSLRNGYYTLEM